MIPILLNLDKLMEWVLLSQSRLKRSRRKKNFTKTIYIAPNPRQFSHQDRVKRAHPKICSFYDHFSLGLLLEKASILTMLEYYLMTDFLCLAWVGKGGRKGQLIARCRAVGTYGNIGDLTDTLSLFQSGLQGQITL